MAAAAPAAAAIDASVAFTAPLGGVGMKLKTTPITANTPLIIRPRTSVCRGPETNALRVNAMLANENHLTLVLRGRMHTIGKGGCMEEGAGADGACAPCTCIAACHMCMAWGSWLEAVCTCNAPCKLPGASCRVTL